MAFIRALIVPLVALATLCGGIVETMHGDVARTGMVHRHPCGLDTAALEHAADAEADDADVDPHDRGWHDGSAPNPACLHHADGRRVITRRTCAVPRRECAPATIRGPPPRC